MLEQVWDSYFQWKETVLLQHTRTSYTTVFLQLWEQLGGDPHMGVMVKWPHTLYGDNGKSSHRSPDLHHLLWVSLNEPHNKPPDSPYLLSFLSFGSLLPLCSCITLFVKPLPAFNIFTALFRDTDSMPNVIALISIHLSKCHSSNLLQAYIVCWNLGSTK